MALLEPFLRRFPGIAAIARNGSMLVGTQWTEAAVRAIYVLVISRWLGPEDFGAWSYATTVYVLAMTVAFFGLETLVPLRIGRDGANGDFIGSTLTVRFLLLGLASVALTIYAFGFERTGPTQVALLIVLPAMIGRGVVLWARSVFFGLGQSGTAFRLAVGWRLIELLAGLIGLALGAGLFALLAIHTLAWIVEAAFSLTRLAQLVTTPMRVDARSILRILRQGVVLGMATISQGALAAMPLIATKVVTDNLAVVGQLGLALQIATLAVIGAQGLLTAALPVVGRAEAKNDPRLRQYPRLIAVLAVLCFGLGIALSELFGPPVIAMVFGAGFAQSGGFLSLALLAGGLHILPAGAFQRLAAQERRWPLAIAGWAGVLAMGLALYGLVPDHGATGALIAATIGWGLRAAILLLWASERVAIGLHGMRRN